MKSTCYTISFVSNFKSNTTMTSNTDRSRTATLRAPTIDISPQKVVLATQQCRQNVIKIKLKSYKTSGKGDFQHYGKLVIHLKFSYTGSYILNMEKYWKFSGKNTMEIFRNFLEKNMKFS